MNLKFNFFIQKQWPGPLTVIVHNKYDSGNTAYRCPHDPWLIEILKKVKHPVYSIPLKRPSLYMMVAFYLMQIIQQQCQ